MTRRPFFKVVSLKSTRTLRGPCAWAERTASAQTNSGDKNLETRLMNQTPLVVCDVLTRRFPTVNRMRWAVPCQVHRLHRLRRFPPHQIQQQSELLTCGIGVICG